MDRERLYRRFAVEEVASALRHRLVNKISAVGALNFHLKRQLPSGTPEAALAVLPLMDAELAQASQTLDLRFVAPAGAAVPVQLGPLFDEVWSALGPPAGIELSRPQGAAPAVPGEPEELALALFCLTENAVEAVGERGRITVRCRQGEPRAGLPMIAIEVADDGPGLADAQRRQAMQPFFTTKPGRLGIGLNVALRIAQRWLGTVELEGARRGLVARLLLPAVTG